MRTLAHIGIVCYFVYLMFSVNAIVGTLSTILLFKLK